MASAAQVCANRSNAQKSTGPRTPEGKAVVAQNAVKHGLLAREGVLRGEDPEEFERHREALLEQLNPAGPLEAILAARIVDLTWRLQRAAQDQNETFGALYDRHTAGTPEPAGPAERGATLGRMILEDCERGAVLERLLRCERRIEGSLFRNLNELRRVHDQGRKADLEAASTLARWREEDDQARKTRAFARPRPVADMPAEDEMCETNPIGPGPQVSQAQWDTAVMSDWPPDGLWKTNPISGAPRGTGILPVNPDHGRDAHTTHGQDAHATELPDWGSTNRPVGQSCQTNPICVEPEVSQVLCGTEVRSDSASNGLRKTNPISEEAAGARACETTPIVEEVRVPGPGASDLTPDPRPLTPGRLCETNPIPGDPTAGWSAACGGPTSRGGEVASREARTDSAKQSQFVANSLSGQGLHAAGRPSAGRPSLRPAVLALPLVGSAKQSRNGTGSPGGALARSVGH